MVQLVKRQRDCRIVLNLEKNILSLNREQAAQRDNLLSSASFRVPDG